MTKQVQEREYEVGEFYHVWVRGKHLIARWHKGDFYSAASGLLQLKEDLVIGDKIPVPAQQGIELSTASGRMSERDFLYFWRQDPRNLKIEKLEKRIAALKGVITKRNKRIAELKGEADG